MKKRLQKAINDYFILCILCLSLCSSCSLADRSAKPYQSVESISSALSDVTNTNDSILAKDRKIARIVATTVISENKKKFPNKVIWKGRKGIDPEKFNKVIRSNAIIRNNWKNNWNETKSEGTSLILVKKDKKDQFLMSAGEVLPVTAKVEKENNEYRLNIYDLFDPKNSSLDISKDYTAPINYLTRRSKLIPKITAVVNTNRYMSDIGLHRITPFDPNRIPVILIHGFKDNPASWVKLINQLQSDPDIRYKYQFWTFTYPTGIPILYSAMRLRENLIKMREVYDPNSVNPNLNRMVLVGHSMGGIIARLLSSNSNNSFSKWLPFESEMENQSAHKMFKFEAEPYISRAIFIATPHKGTAMASSSIARFFNTIIKIPLEIQDSFISTFSLNPDISLKDQRLISRMKSISNLRPNSDFIRSLQSTTINSNIATHSIIGIGRLSWWKKLETTDDFVVSYNSAHIQNADSELTVAAWHDLHKNSKAISEVGRILKLQH